MWRVAYVRESGEPFVLAPPDPENPDLINPAYQRERVKLTDMIVGTDHGRLFSFWQLDGKHGHEMRRMLEDALGRVVKGFVPDPDGTKNVLNDLLSWVELWPTGQFSVRSGR